MWKLYRIQISESTNQVFLAHCQTNSFLACLWMFFCCKGRIEKLWQRPHGQQIPKHLHRALSRKGLLTPVLKGYTIYKFSAFFFFYTYMSTDFTPKLLNSSMYKVAFIRLSNNEPTIRELVQDFWWNNSSIWTQMYRGVRCMRPSKQPQQEEVSPFSRCMYTGQLSVFWRLG